MFLAPKTYEKQLRIEKLRLSHQVWSHGGSTFKKKKGHETAIFPALQKLTHMYLGGRHKKLPLDVVFSIRHLAQFVSMRMAVPGNCYKLSGKVVRARVRYH